MKNTICAKRKIGIIFVLALFCLILPQTAQAATYYLDANATGAQTGLSWQDAWTTLAQAQGVLQDGDICYIRNGDYGTFNEGSGAARSDWITYKADEGHNNVNFSGISINHGGNPSYLRFEGVNIYGHTTLNNTSYIYFYGCKFEGSHYNENTHGINSTTTGTAPNVTIDNCEITHFWRGILVRGNSYWTIKNCHIHNIAEDGINLGAAEVSHILIEGCEINDITYVGRGVGTEHEDCIHYEVPTPSTDIVLRNNKLHDCRSQGLAIYGQRAPVTRIVVENNLVYNIGAFAVPIEGTDDIDIINNTIIDKDTPPSCLRFSLSHAARNTTITNFYNNIVSGLVVDADRGGYTVNIINSGNNIFGTEYDLSSGYFVDYASDNYTLSSDSPAIGFADGLIPEDGHAPATDILSNPRDAQPDAGCYEYIPTYYVSPVGGTIIPHDGLTKETAFTLAEAQTEANSRLNEEITFLLASGNYGNFSEITKRTNWTTYKADVEAEPVFESITIGNGTTINAYLKFYGIKVNKTFGSGNMVHINNANNIEFHSGQWRGYDRYQDIQPLISGNNIVVDGIEIFYEQNQVYSLPPPSKVDGLQISGSNFTVKNCHIHDFSSSALQINSGSGLIENCHIHNQHTKWPGFREGIDEPRHGAGIALVDVNNLTIRNNIMHACGASGGHIFFYSPGMNNIVIENNLFYDGKGIGMQSDASWGRNCKFNNNIVVTNWQSWTPSTSPQRYQRGVNFRFDSYANDFEFYNNIIIAYMETDGTDISGESDNNIVYAFKPTLGWIGSPLWVNTGLGPNSVILNSQVLGYGWMWKDILEAGGWDPEADFFVAPDFTPWQDNSAYTWSGIVSDFSIKEGSPAIGFADALVSAGGHASLTDILGNLRDNQPDAGCYEYVPSTFLYGDVNGDSEITAFDAALAAHIAVDLEHPDIKNRAAAEVSGDAEISAYDAALIAQRAVGLIEKFPVEG